MVDFIKAIERPFTDFKKFMLGLLFSVIPIVNFIAMGYELECAKTANKKQFLLPEWKNYGKLFKRGLVSFCISVIYLVIPLLLIIAGLGRALLEMFKENPNPEILVQVVIQNWIVLLIAFLLLIFVSYVLYSANINYAIKGRFKDGFSLDVFRKAFTWKYFMVWFIGIFYYLFWVLLLSFIPYVGGVIAGFIGGVTLFTLLGQLYSEIKQL